jgi:hypothetical protein
MNLKLLGSSDNFTNAQNASKYCPDFNKANVRSFVLPNELKPFHQCLANVVCLAVKYGEVNQFADFEACKEDTV